GGQYGAGAALDHSIGQILQSTDSARGNDGHRDGIGHGTSQLKVKSGLGAVAIHAGQQQFAGTVFGHFRGPFHHIQPGPATSAVGKDFPAGSLIAGTDTTRIDGDNHALLAMMVTGCTYQIRVADGSTVDGNLVRTGIEQALDISHFANTATDRQRDEDLAGHLFDDGQNQIAVIRGGGNVQESQLVGTLIVVFAGDLDRITCIDQIHKVDPLDHPTGGDIQTGDNAAG